MRSPAMEEERENRETRGAHLRAGEGAAAHQHSPCSADTARLLQEGQTQLLQPRLPSRAPSGGPARPRSRSWRGILGFPSRLTQGDGAAVGVEVKRDLPTGNHPIRGEGTEVLPNKSRVWSPHLFLRGPRGSGGPCSQVAGSKSRAVALVMHQAG